MTQERIECDIAVIGAGVVGLAIARELSSRASVVLLETFPKFGQETSSRNSEVVHSGIYYPVGSKKTEWCVRGRGLLYDYCDRKGVPFQKCGKFVVATQQDEEAYLDKLESHSRGLGVPCERASGEAVREREPWIRVSRGLYFPESGIVDSHSFMAALERDVLERGALIAYRYRLERVEREGERWLLALDAEGRSESLVAGTVVNAAGLAAAEISNQALGGSQYAHRYCRGRYLGLSSRFSGKFQHLIYPVPPKDGLGIHITLDLSGAARLGPDVDWCADVGYAGRHALYDADWEALKEPFVNAARRYCPGVNAEDLSPGLVGIRPKLFVGGEARPDFLVERHGTFVHCLGIESPGLTAALAIAEAVAALA